MSIISLRDLLNSSDAILDRVRAGETMTVKDNGHAAATLIPPSLSPFEQLLLSGNVRPAGTGALDFRAILRVQQRKNSADVLADLRGDR